MDQTTYVVEGSHAGERQAPRSFESRAEANAYAIERGLTWDWVAMREEP